MKKVSMIVPVYNVQGYLSDCLTSIINQDYSNLEIIIVDDGSTDGSLKICEDYAKKDSRIKIVYENNAGPGAARNRGIDCATGEFITFADGDDILENNYVSSLVAQQEKFNSDIAISFYKEFDAKGYYLIMNPVPGDAKYNGVYLPDKLLRLFSSINSWEDGAAWTKLYRKSLFKDIRYPEHHVIFEDTFTTWRLMLLAKRVSFENTINYSYRLHRKGSTINTISEVNFYYVMVKALEERIVIMSQAGLDASYLYDYYKECLEQLYNTALKEGNYGVSRASAFRMQVINKYCGIKEDN